MVLKTKLNIRVENECDAGGVMLKLSGIIKTEQNFLLKLWLQFTGPDLSVVIFHPHARVWERVFSLKFVIRRILKITRIVIKSLAQMKRLQRFWLCLVEL